VDTNPTLGTALNSSKKLVLDKEARKRFLREVNDGNDVNLVPMIAFFGAKRGSIDASEDRL
jgi:hypothetical protein